MLDEKALRRPHFLAGSPLRLADGQTWILPGPPGRNPSATSQNLALNSEYREIVAAIRDAEDDNELRRSELAMTLFLLAHNYDLKPDDFQALLGLPSGDPRLADLQQACRELVCNHVRGAAVRPGPIKERRRPRRPRCLRVPMASWTRFATAPAARLVNAWSLTRLHFGRHA